MIPDTPIKLTAKDFQPSCEVRWCPGCGDYVILATLQRLLAEQGVKREEVCFVSGIGCSSRFPYYMATYGFHTIHGRAPAIATGLKATRPELQVWVITGDGDSLSIGGNHLIHALRRNVDLKILLFNNRIYGLTKGQFSPTSPKGTQAKSTPYGSIDEPFNPVRLALGAGATFVARTTAADPAHLKAILARAAAHKGSAIVEILQNCVVFNDGTWDHVTEKDVRDTAQLRLEPGRPLLFAKGTKAVRVREGRVEVIDAAGAELTPWDEGAAPGLAFDLAGCMPPDGPMPVGVFRAVQAPVHHEEDAAQEGVVRKTLGDGDLAKVLRSGDCWSVP